ncbi:nuclear factor 7, brain-like [Gouania willdenowi]|uniref:Nuclear factor 7, brain-like n=1 Tax=Gouania willdenowi TaxID=441366 RepID=A0A8C5D6H3_GOUWI|nr:nuclear factor 7, brain-like [Gouania willdenowi]
MSSLAEDDLCCPVCTDVFQDPVVLSCSHSFCKSCLQDWWKRQKLRTCPCCKRKSSRSDPPCNLALKNLCETFLQNRNQKQPSVCGQHSETLRLFCLDHQQPVCLVCRESKTHSEHRFRPLDEAAQDCREELQIALKPVRDNLALFEQFKEKYELTVAHVKTQAQQVEEKIKEQFWKLHQFLQKEEEARLAALTEEAKQKNQMMMEKISALSRDMETLSNTIAAAQKDLEVDDASFLRNYKAVEMKVQQLPRPDVPELHSGALIDVAKYLGNMSFNIWKKMGDMVAYMPVILDPNTADPELLVSADLSSVRSGEQQQLPTNPERSRFSCSVLGADGFDSGTHSWAVEVGKNKDWEVGMLAEYTQARGLLKSGLWRVLFSGGKFTAFSTNESEKSLSVKKLKRIRVKLDYEGGTLSFWNLDTNKHLHTFTDSFTDTLFPYVYTENPFPLKILSKKVSVAVRD